MAHRMTRKKAWTAWGRALWSCECGYDVILDSVPLEAFRWPVCPHGPEGNRDRLLQIEEEGARE